MVRGLVVVGPAGPDLAPGIYIPGPHQADLARPHPGQALDPDHGADRRGQRRQGGLNNLIRDRGDWGPLGRFGPPTSSDLT